MSRCRPGTCRFTRSEERFRAKVAAHQQVPHATRHAAGRDAMHGVGGLTHLVDGTSANLSRLDQADYLDPVSSPVALNT